MKSQTGNTYTYLYKNFNGLSYSSSSPAAYFSTERVLYMNSVSTTGSMTTTSASGASSIRPSISLISSAKVTGTSSDPYVVTGY